MNERMNKRMMNEWWVGGWVDGWREGGREGGTDGQMDRGRDGWMDRRQMDDGWWTGGWMNGKLQKCMSTKAAIAHRIRWFHWALHHQIAECMWACPTQANELTVDECVEDGESMAMPNEFYKQCRVWCFYSPFRTSTALLIYLQKWSSFALPRVLALLVISPCPLQICI